MSSAAGRLGADGGATVVVPIHLTPSLARVAVIDDDREPPWQAPVPPPDLGQAWGLHLLGPGARVVNQQLPMRRHGVRYLQDARTTVYPRTRHRTGGLRGLGHVHEGPLINADGEQDIAAVPTFSDNLGRGPNSRPPARSPAASSPSISARWGSGTYHGSRMTALIATDPPIPPPASRTR
jgi:hypothetical protein